MSMPYRQASPPPAQPLDLGPLERRYAGQPGTAVIFGAFFLACTLIVAVLILGGPHALTGKVVVRGCLGALSAILGVRCVRLAMAALGTRIEVHERGLLLVNPGWVESARWDEIASLVTRTVATSGGAILHSTLVKRDGGVLELSDVVADLSDLTRDVHERTAAALLPAARADFEDGRRLDFGPFTASRAGLEHGGQTYPWSEVGVAMRASGKLSFPVGRGWVSADEGAVPNLRVLIELCQLARAT